MKTRRMNRWDSMLAWLAQRPQNKWSNVKANAQRLSEIEHPDREWSPLRHAMEWAGPLIRLGHAEFDLRTRTVAASSPGLLTISSSERIVLYGYWGPDLRAAMRRFGGKRLVHRPRRGPTCWAIQTDGCLVDELSESLGVWWVEDTSASLLERLPPLSTLLIDLSPSQLSGEGYWEKFDYISDSFGKWRTSHQPLAEPGLYQRKDGQSAQVYITKDHRQLALKTMDEKLAAKWSCYPRRFGWIFDEERGTLLIPRGTPDLPVLVSRGLTMKSARLPTRLSLGRRPWWKYVSVSWRQASEAARVMEQELLKRRLSNV